MDKQLSDALRLEADKYRQFSRLLNVIRRSGVPATLKIESEMHTWNTEIELAPFTPSCLEFMDYMCQSLAGLALQLDHLAENPPTGSGSGHSSPIDENRQGGPGDFYQPVIGPQGV